MDLLTIDDKRTQTLFIALKEIFGLPEHCTAFELRMAVDEVVTIKAEFAAEIKNVAAFAQLEQIGIIKARVELPNRIREALRQRNN